MRAFATALGRTDIEPTDHFFEKCGGSSLTAAHAAALLGVPPGLVQAAPTVRSLTALLRRGQGAGGGSAGLGVHLQGTTAGGRLPQQQQRELEQQGGQQGQQGQQQQQQQLEQRDQTQLQQRGQRQLEEEATAAGDAGQEGTLALGLSYPVFQRLGPVLPLSDTATADTRADASSDLSGLQHGPAWDDRLPGPHQGQQLERTEAAAGGPRIWEHFGRLSGARPGGRKGLTEVLGTEAAAARPFAAIGSSALGQAAPVLIPSALGQAALGMEVDPPALGREALALIPSALGQAACVVTLTAGSRVSTLLPRLQAGTASMGTESWPGGGLVPAPVRSAAGATLKASGFEVCCQGTANLPASGCQCRNEFLSRFHEWMGT